MRAASQQSHPTIGSACFFVFPFFQFMSLYESSGVFTVNAFLCLSQCPWGRFYLVNKNKGSEFSDSN